jgi:adenosylhomocysteine nucleosidase
VTGVVAALPAEARWLGTSTLTVRVGGVGAEHARRAAKELIAQGARALVSWGTAAARAPGLDVGTLVIADRVLAGAEALTPDLGWNDRIVAALRGVVPVTRGAIACPMRVLRSAADKRALGETTGAIAADMESAAIGSVAREAGAPWIVLRVVSDTVDMAVPASVVSAIDAKGQLSVGRLIGGLARRPGDVAAFPALARGMRLAGRTMRAVAPVLAGM